MANYINNIEMYNELKNSIENDKITEKLHEMFFLLSTKISKTARWNYKNYIDDLATEGYLKCVKRFKSFNLEKKNVFAYFQSIIYFTFMDIEYLEIKQTNIKFRMSESYYANLSKEFSGIVNPIKIQLEEIEDNYNIDPVTISIFNSKLFNFFNNKKFTNKEELYIIILKYYIEHEDEEKYLLETENNKIIFFNNDHNNYLGHCICKKCKNINYENVLGKILMDYRTKLQQNLLFTD